MMSSLSSVVGGSGGSVLDPKEHSRIIANFEQVCTVAGIQGHFMYESMLTYCGPDEVTWVRKFWDYKRDGISGLILHGVKRPDTRCQSIAAALVRNFVDARVIPLNTLIESTLNGSTPPSPTVLIIPNLFVSAMGKNMPAWRVQAIYDLLLERSIKSKPTVAYVEDLTGLVALYGEPFHDFLSRFVIVTE
jgi:hypothetical protein